MSLQSKETNSIDLELRKTTISYRDLMKNRVHEILVVASLYDSFKLEEDGRLTELVFAEYQDMNFTNAPHVSRVGTASRALESIREKHYDLIISMPRISDMDPFEFGERVREIRPDLPVILLVASVKESNHYVEMSKYHPGSMEKIFFWSGDSAVLPAIIKYSEDKRNAERDILRGLVRAIIVVEDTPQYYSVFLPMIYKEITRHTAKLMKQEYKDDLKLLRVRSRPRILLATNYEEALEYFERYQQSILAVISDVKFPKNGIPDEEAGIKFLSTIQARESSVPLVLHSLDQGLKNKARKMNVRFFNKNSQNLLNDLREFVVKHCGFDNLMMSTAQSKDSIIVKDLSSFEKALDVVSVESLEYHAQRNHFSNWLAMRGYLEIAAKIKAFRDLSDIEQLRKMMKGLVVEQRKKQHKEAIIDYYDPENYDLDSRIVRIGDGSLGGKARGIVFVSIFLKRFNWVSRFPDVDIEVPRTAVIATDIFDEFIQTNQIKQRFSKELADDVIDSMFLKGDFNHDFVNRISSYLKYHKVPLAIRSSSLLEDSIFQPFAGIYSTYMIPSEMEHEERLKRVLEAVKLVYASTFHRRARAYMGTTGNRLEDEKMAVVLMEIVGSKRGDYFYPTFSGNLQTYNFYPTEGANREDGIANVCLGLGRTVVNGEKALRFSPKHPENISQLSEKQSILRSGQSSFYALRTEVSNQKLTGNEEDNLVHLPLREAEAHNALQYIASTYSPDSNQFSESFDNDNQRVITFSNILQNKKFPLAAMLKDLMAFGRRGMGCEVEVEFAADISTDSSTKPIFSILQIRPLITHHEIPLINPQEIEYEDFICQSDNCLGNGIITNIRDIIFVKLDNFSPDKTTLIAEEISEWNAEFDNSHPYLLIGPGRWGSSDPQLGVPVNWANISNVGAIVEVGLPDFYLDPSFGSHFFQNLTSLGIGYFVTSPQDYMDKINFSWINSIQSAKESAHLRRLSFDEPICVQIDGQSGKGFILKCGDVAKHRSGS